MEYFNFISLLNNLARFTLIGVNIQAATFSASNFEIWTRGKFDNASYTPLAVAISKK